ncbi:Protein of unknown function [Chishuiella changwenlii]|jgi:hypothetical protein|uniref:DUF4240 domain-containing protein n=1 Tax=Chishuiella changwenlii TaxID=1434701 RepID=A0A1M7BPV3_9FLAO|nr:DUF4240 domain-containing protein [Chishuiella changwenlii]GGF03239.1 hypothetical protein GCM10010984_20840 [Chishuiella changwenlii]SHL57078.1 Protein of unknown function [Chishuiella changwenlii]
MDFLDDLFNSFSVPAEPISGMLEEDLFWQIIENSLQEASNLNEQRQSLALELERLTAEDIIGFQIRLENLLFSLHSPEIWCAACIMNDETDPKHFFYFKNWIVSQGRELFEKALSHPDRLSYYFKEGFNEDDLYEFENFHSITNELFMVKVGLPIANYIEKKQLENFTENFPKPDFDWDDENFTNLQIFCPKLYKIFVEDYFVDEEDEEEDEDDIL